MSLCHSPTLCINRKNLLSRTAQQQLQKNPATTCPATTTTSKPKHTLTPGACKKVLHTPAESFSPTKQQLNTASTQHPDPSTLLWAAIRETMCSLSAQQEIANPTALPDCGTTPHTPHAALHPTPHHPFSSWHQARVQTTMAPSHVPSQRSCMTLHYTGFSWQPTGREGGDASMRLHSLPPHPPPQKTTTHKCSHPHGHPHLTTPAGCISRQHSHPNPHPASHALV